MFVAGGWWHRQGRDFEGAVTDGGTTTGVRLHDLRGRGYAWATASASASAVGKAAATWLLIIDALRLRSPLMFYGFRVRRLDRFFNFPYSCIVFWVCTFLAFPLSLHGLGVRFSSSSLFFSAGGSVDWWRVSGCYGCYDTPLLLNSWLARILEFGKLVSWLR